MQNFLKTILAACLMRIFATGSDGASNRAIADRLMKNYEPGDPEDPVNVKIGIYINHFYAVSEQSMDYVLSMYLRQAWRDKQLTFDPEDGKDKFKMPESLIRSVWKPDLFFRNEKGASFHTVTVPNRLMRVNSTGHVWYVIKVSATLSCPMRLQKYPFDTQSCPIMFESFGYTMDSIIFGWLNSPVEVDAGVQLPAFTLMDVILYDCSQNYTAGAFPCLEARVMLRRDVGFYILQIHLPSIMITCISWLTFWFSVKDVAARTGLGLTTLLTSVLLSAWSRYQLPKVSYATAMDIWNTVCFLFIAMSLLEFVLVQFLSRGDSSESEKSEEAVELKKRLNKVKDSGDKICRIAFPVAFLLFLIIYFAIFAP